MRTRFGSASARFTLNVLLVRLLTGCPADGIATGMFDTLIRQLILIERVTLARYPSKRFRITDGEERRETFFERTRAHTLSQSDSVLVPVEHAPVAFWNSIWHAMDYCLLAEQNMTPQRLERWSAEVAYQFGDFKSDWDSEKLKLVLVFGRGPRVRGEYSVPERLTMIELLVDEYPGDGDFSYWVDEAAHRWQVGISMDGNRFMPVASELLHDEIVTPTLRLLTTETFRDVDAAYRKAWRRVLEGDPAGAITSCSTTIEEVLRRLGCSGTNLQGLSRDARRKNMLSAGVQQQIEKLEAFREQSDAHRVGTDEINLAMLVVHLTGSLLHYLANLSNRGDA